MKADATIATYQRMRQEPMWRLLASTNGPVVIGLLQTCLYEHEKELPASLLTERIGRELESLNARGLDFPQTAQIYIAAWLSEGFLERRFLPGAAEESYELSSAAVQAIRFLSSSVSPHSSATESRLSIVIQSLISLAGDTDTDQPRRLEALLREQERIEEEIALLQKGEFRVLSQAQAMERTREIIGLMEDLIGDFRRVRDQFETLNRDLREKIINNEGSRGEVLDSLFAGIDVISESEAGRTFSAFWKHLMDSEGAAALDQALDDIMVRDFIRELDPKDRRFLLRLTRNLLDQGGVVHEVMQNFARGLRYFVQSREYLEQRRLNQVIKEAQKTALELKEYVRAGQILPYQLELTSSRFRSVSQLVLYDTALAAPPKEMEDGDSLPVSLEEISDMVAKSEIDFRSLKADIRKVLEHRSQASIGEILEVFPAVQGLGSVAGLLALGSRYGIQDGNRERVKWTGEDGQHRSAYIPRIFFMKEDADELV